MAKLDVTKMPNNPPRVHNKLEGVGGWLVFYIITLFISILYTVYDIFANPQFYFFESGAIVYGSVVIIFAMAIWAVVVAISIIKKLPKAIIWAKEFMIAQLVLAIFTPIYVLGYYSAEDFDLILYDSFRAIVYFSIWFSYLSVSKRVKNTFKDTKLRFVRGLAVSGIAIAAVIVLSTISSIFQGTITNEPETILNRPATVTETLSAGFGNYHEFANQLIQSDISVEYSSSDIVNIYLITSSEEFDKWAEGYDFNVYEGCFKEGQSSGKITCTVDTGGVLIINPGNQDLTYTLSMR